MNLSPLVEQLVDTLKWCLPETGLKKAQRIAFHLLERDRSQGLRLAKVIEEAMSKISHCKSCRIWSETELCQCCANPNRDQQLLCIAETPSDVLAIEQTGYYRGYYFVLMGHLSPLDGIGPQEIGVNELLQRVQKSSFREIILATNHTVEGEATAHYLAELLKSFPFKISRLAHGIPAGGELIYLDSKTLSDAIRARN